jgi:hypothetical protein
MSDIQSAFSLGNNLGAYYNARWYKENNARGNFVASGPISFSSFAGTRNTSPVVPSPVGGVTYTTSQAITFPTFNTLTVTVKGGNGGTQGVAGNCNGGGNGGPGYDSKYGDYVTGAGGAANGGVGSTATRTWTITDENQASIIALYGTQPYGTVGSGGGAGSTGYNTRSTYTCTDLRYYESWPYVACLAGFTSYYCDSATGAGSGGASGYIKLEWS